MNARGTVPSPCISVCRMDEATGWCEGCMRTLDEIAAWSLLDDAEKRAVWAELGPRRDQPALQAVQLIDHAARALEIGLDPGILA